MARGFHAASREVQSVGLELDHVILVSLSTWKFCSSSDHTLIETRQHASVWYVSSKNHPLDVEMRDFCFVLIPSNLPDNAEVSMATESGSAISRLDLPAGETARVTPPPLFQFLALTTPYDIRGINKAPAWPSDHKVYLSSSLPPSICRPRPAVKTIMETISHFTPDTSLVDTMASSSDSPAFLKLEDLHSSPPLATTFDTAVKQQTPPPVIVKSHPAKKRKSWGQQLPEPSTNLPPRKRAKTDDEKEQRRIERIKRNRAAAHNSRERKRQETDVLAVALARANAELDAYRNLHGPLPASVVLPEVTLCVDDRYG